MVGTSSRGLYPVLAGGGAGALVSVGDVHAAQGDGEVCVAAIECAMRARFRVRVRRDVTVREPHYETSAVYGTTGIGTSIEDAARHATRAMGEHLTGRYGLSRQEAYVLCSVAMDLKICEAVDMPHYLVGAHLPKACLPV